MPKCVGEALPKELGSLYNLTTMAKADRMENKESPPEQDVRHLLKSGPPPLLVAPVFLPSPDLIKHLCFLLSNLITGDISEKSLYPISVKPDRSKHYSRQFSSGKQT